MTTRKKQSEAAVAVESEAIKPVEIIVAYKGFTADWKCRDYQYAVGRSYTHDGVAVACESGFHACEYPLDVFAYYPPAGSRFALVEQSGELSRHSGDSKVASSKIAIKAEINFAGIIKAAIEYTTSRCKPVDIASPASATGDQGAASATGYHGAASATGYQGAASATGYQGAASATGHQGAASATGHQGAASATGDQGAASATGHQGAASATGHQGAASATGTLGRAMGVDGNAIFLVFRDDNYNNIIHAKAAIVGRDGIKPGVFYTLSEDGEFVEVAS